MLNLWSGFWSHVDHCSPSDLTMTTPAPLPTQCPTRNCDEQHHQPSSDRKPDFVAMYEPAPTGVMEQNITSELELLVSGQVCELAASSITVGVHVVYLGMEVSPAQTPTTDITFLATLFCCFDFGEDDCLPPLLHPNRTAPLLSHWSFPASVSRLLSKYLTVSSQIMLFCASPSVPPQSLL